MFYRKAVQSYSIFLIFAIHNFKYACNNIFCVAKILNFSAKLRQGSKLFAFCGLFLLFSQMVFRAMDKHLDTMFLYVTCLLIIPNIIRRYRGNIAYFFCHVIESNTFCTGNMALTCVMLPWTEDKHLPFGAGIE